MNDSKSCTACNAQDFHDEGLPYAFLVGYAIGKRTQRGVSDVTLCAAHQTLFGELEATVAMCEREKFAQTMAGNVVFELDLTAEEFKRVAAAGGRRVADFQGLLREVAGVETPSLQPGDTCVFKKIATAPANPADRLRRVDRPIAEVMAGTNLVPMPHPAPAPAPTPDPRSN